MRERLRLYLKKLEMGGLSPFVNECGRAPHATCVKVWERRCALFDRTRKLKLSKTPSANLSLLRCEKEVSYCQMFKDEIAHVCAMEIPAMRRFGALVF